MSTLLQLQPRKALLVHDAGTTTAAAAAATEGGGGGGGGSDGGDGDGRGRDGGSPEELEEIDMLLVQRGDVLKVLPGTKVPCDGLVTRGASFVDESIITGEAAPVAKAVGSTVYGSTVNQKGCFYMSVKSVGADSALQQIVSDDEHCSVLYD